MTLNEGKVIVNKFILKGEKIMKRMMKWIGKMKKSKNEGFSLVELIIVISIMAILMGVVGTQVLPYLNKSKESNDNALLGKYHTAAVSAFAFNADKVSAQDYTITLKSGSETISPACDGLLDEWYGLLGVASGGAFAYFTSNSSSPNGKAVQEIQIKYLGATNGKITLQAYKSSPGVAGNEVLKTIESK